MKEDFKLYCKACWINIKPIADVLLFVSIVVCASGLALYSPLMFVIVLVAAGLIALHRANMKEYKAMKDEQ